MHEQGYQFIGPTSYYRLTIPEMRVLAGGFAVMQQTKEDAQNGVTAEHREGLAEYNEKISAKGGGGSAAHQQPPAGQPQHPAGAAPGASMRGRRGTRGTRRRR